MYENVSYENHGRAVRAKHVDKASDWIGHVHFKLCHNNISLYLKHTFNVEKLNIFLRFVL